MFACKVHDLRDLGFCDLIRVDAAFADPVVVDMQHYSCGGFVVLAEEAFQNMHDELHRRVVIVENENPVHVRPLGLRLGLGDDRSARTALLVSTLAIIVGHTGGWHNTDRKVSLCKAGISWPEHCIQGCAWPRRHMTTQHNNDLGTALPSRQFTRGLPRSGTVAGIHAICRGQEEITIA